MGEGTFSEVLKCQNALDGKSYACKKMKQKYDRFVRRAKAGLVSIVSNRWQVILSQS